jgi:ribosome modulation factor
MIGMAGRMTPEEVVKQLTDELHYARLFMRLDLSGADLLDGLDTQVTNSTRHADDVMSAESRGFQDGRMGKTRDDCPYSDPELIQSWRKWWKNGVEQRAVEQPGSKMKSVPRGRKGRQTRMEGTEATQDSPRRAMRRSKKAKRKQRSDAGQKRGPRKMRNTPQVVDFPHAAQ